MRGWAAAMIGALLLASPATARPRWTATWGAAQIALADDAALSGALTLHQTVRVSAGGTGLRIRLSNAFGRRALAIGAARVVGRRLTFGGRATTRIAPGAETWSDSVALPVAAGSDLAITLYLPDADAARTGQPGARATGLVLPGNHIDDATLAGARTTTRWYALADVAVTGATASVVAIGDSITEGYGAGIDRNARWPDVLAARLRTQAATRGIGVVNTGIGGNRVLRDGIGPGLLARFDRDVVARPGVRWAIVDEGINDLGMLARDPAATPAAHAAIVSDILAAYRTLVARGHARGIRVVGGTLAPFVGNAYYRPDAAAEADRQAINAAIRRGGLFDAIVDFDAVLRDPARPDRLRGDYDSGDHLHPSDAGYRAMGEAVPLALFGPDAPPRIALTFDDIPAHGPLPPGETRLSVIRTIAAALAQAKAPAFGFLNAGFGRDDATAAPAIRAWRAAGLPLGNHSYAHGNLDTVGASAFVADVVRNEAPLAAATGGSDWHWFRYPFLAEGHDPAARDAVRTALRDRNYRIAAVSMSFGDFLWNPPYAACAARGNAAAIARLETGFLADARSAALAASADARARFGRDIPHVLLLHVGSFDARMLPRLLALYRGMGYAFVPLAEAQRDPYYAAATDLTLAGPTPTLAAPLLAGPPAGLCS